MVFESALAEAEIEYHDLLSTSLYYANRVKDGKGVLDTDSTYRCTWTSYSIYITASWLTVGAILCIGTTSWRIS